MMLGIVLYGCGQTLPIDVDPIPPGPPIPGLVAFIGDSITAGWQLPASYINAGISGQNSGQMLARFSTSVLAHHPAVVEILAGTNDVRESYPANVNSIATMAEEASASGACVIIGTIPPDTNWAFTGFITSQAQMNTIIANFNAEIFALGAAYGYEIADYHSVLVLPDGDQNSYLFNDGTHPDAAGHAAMWEVVSPLIAECLEK
jgi:lysophospholipase L1-like esterase